MATNDRRAKIEAMLREEPDDVFLRYALAMEMSREGQIEEALVIFSSLCAERPPHVPAFFRSAQVLAEDERPDSARDFLRRGIEEARNQQDFHAAAEMSELLADLGAYGK